jgi:hypothetical protein
MKMALSGLLVVLTLHTTPNVSAQVPRIFFDVPEVTVPVSDSGGWLNVYIDNYQDTIFGFQFVLLSSRPDLVSFDFTNGGFDTAGTLVSGFEYMQGLDPFGDQTAFWYRCIADVPFTIGSTPGFGPQQGGIAVRIRYRLLSDSLPTDTPTIKSLLTVQSPFDFSDPYGVSIGVVVDTSIDTTYWHCTNLLGDSCTNWMQVSSASPLIDSIAVDTIRNGYLDTTQVIADDGWMEVVNRLVCDNDNDGQVSIGDLVCLIQYMFKPSSPQACPDIYCDPSNSGEVDIADLTILVAYMFKGGPPP